MATTAYNPHVGEFVKTPKGEGRISALRLSRGPALYVVELAAGGEDVFFVSDLRRDDSAAIDADEREHYAMLDRMGVRA